MSKTIIDENQKIDLLNEKLRAHADYQEGMKVVGTPGGYQGGDLTGYEIEGPGPVRGIVADIDAEVEKEYELRVSPRGSD